MLLRAMEAAAGPVPDGPRARFDLNGAFSSFVFPEVPSLPLPPLALSAIRRVS